jgi:hypothetical protein
VDSQADGENPENWNSSCASLNQKILVLQTDNDCRQFIRDEEFIFGEVERINMQERFSKSTCCNRVLQNVGILYREAHMSVHEGNPNWTIFEQRMKANFTISFGVHVKHAMERFAETLFLNSARCNTDILENTLSTLHAAGAAASRDIADMHEHPSQANIQVNSNDLSASPARSWYITSASVLMSWTWDVLRAVLDVSGIYEDEQEGELVATLDMIDTKDSAIAPHVEDGKTGVDAANRWLVAGTRVAQSVAVGVTLFLSQQAARSGKKRMDGECPVSTGAVASSSRTSSSLDTLITRAETGTGHMESNRRLSLLPKNIWQVPKNVLGPMEQKAFEISHAFSSFSFAASTAAFVFFPKFN